MIKIFQIISIGAALSNLILTIFLLSRESRSTLNRVYFLWGSCITLWNIGVFFMFRVPDVESATFWARFLHFGVIFLPVSLVHLAMLVGQVRIGRWIYAFYALQAAFALTNFSDLFIRTVHHTGYAFYSVAGPVYWPFICVYSAAAIATLIILYKKQKHVFPLHRVRLHSLMVAAAILIVFGLNDITPIFGVYEYPGTNWRIYPLGSLAAIFYSLIISYSVLQHQLLDVHVTLGRAAAYLVRLLFLFLVGFLLLLIVALILPEEFSILAFFSSLAALVMSGAAASIFFPRLFGQGDDALERRILGDRFEYHDKIQGFIRSIPWSNDTNLLLQEFRDLLVNTVKLRSYQVILFDESSGKYSLFHAHPQPDGEQLPPSYSQDSAIFDLFRTMKLSYLPLNPAYAMTVDAELAQEARKELQPFSPEFCFPFASDEGPFGLLLLGRKANGEPYTANDLYMFDLLVKSLAIVMNQIRLKNKVLQAEEMELLGRMSRGMAHDLNNLLTPISTFLQLSAAGHRTIETQASLLNIAVRNSQTIRDYIQEALFFSQTQTAQFHPSRCDLLVQRVVDSFQTMLSRKQIEVILRLEEGLIAEIDEVLIQRLISNLLSNAIDASPSGSTIAIEMAAVPGDERDAEWVRLRVIDHGSGISRENLKRVMRPYFTTKIHGDDSRGVGLGLAISQKIVRLHSGEVQIASEEGKGTTIQVDLPARQEKEILRPTAVTA